MNDLFRSIHCLVHIRIICCGYPPYICDKCTTDGWVGRGGDGGPTHAINTRTNITKWNRGIDLEQEKKEK